MRSSLVPNDIAGKAQLFRAVTELAAVPLLLLDVESRVLYAAPAVEPVLGHAPGAMLGQIMLDAAHPDERELVRESFARCLSRPGETVVIDHRLRRADGLWRWYECHVTNLLGRAEVGAVVVVPRDVTERVEVAEQLRESEERLSRSERDFATLVENLPDVVFRMDLAGHILYASPAAKAIAWPLDGLAGKTVRETGMPAENWRLFETKFREAVETGAAAWEDGMGGRRYRTRLIVENSAAGKPESMLGITEDVTAQREAERQALTNEQRYKLLQKTLKATVFALDLKGDLTYITPEWLRENNMTLEEMRRGEWSGIIHPEDLPRVQHIRSDSFARGVPSTMEIRKRDPDGEFRWYFVHMAPLRDLSGRITEWVGVSLNVDDRRRAQADLAQSQERYRLLTEAVPQIVWTSRVDGTVEFINEYWFAYTGLPRERMTDWAAVVHPDDLDRLVGDANRAQAAGEPCDLEYRVRRASDGVYRWHLGRMLPLRDAGGRIMKWLGVATDMEERKRVEAELSEWKKRYEAGMRASGQIFYEWESTTDRIRWGGESERIIGYRIDELPGTLTRWNGITHPDDRPGVEGEYERVSRSGEPFRFEYRVKAKDGRYVDVEDRADFIRDATGAIVRWVGFISDITERRRAEVQIRLLNAELERRVQERTAELRHANTTLEREVEERRRGEVVIRESQSKLKDLSARLLSAQEDERRRISRDMHDDLGQILATVNLAIQRALDRPAQRRREALLSQALESNEIAMARVRELSHLLHPSVLDDLGLKAAVRSFVSEFVEKRGIEVETVLQFDSGDIPSAVKINLYRIVQEALNNVAKHSAARHASVRMFASENDMKLIVKDDGRGFDFSGRVYKTLGLLGIRERAELSGGGLEVITAPGRGTEIRVSIPRRR